MTDTQVRSFWDRRGGATASLAGGLCALLLLLSATFTAPAVGTAAVEEITCEVVQVPMRDGTQLATEVYRPAGPGPHPVVLSRTPYNRVAKPTGSDCDSRTMRIWAENGYVALNQDVRGRYRSAGSFDPQVQETADGYDAVEWAAAQPWSTGKVGMLGGSYVGLTQWQAAIGAPPHLAAIAPHNTASDYHDNWTYANGVFDLWFGLSWNLRSLGPENYRRALLADGRSPEEAERQVDQWAAAGGQRILDEWVMQLPLASFREYDGNKAPWYADWLEHPFYDQRWAAMDPEDKYQRVDVPVLNSGGWYDIFQVGTVRNFQGMQASGGTEGARNGSRLVMSAASHNPKPGTPGTAVGEIDFGPNNRYSRRDAIMRFFDYHLKGIDNGADDDPAVEVFVMVPPDEGLTGDGFWVTGDTFPLPGTRTQTYRLGSGGNANTSAGDGLLLPGGENDTATSDSFIYDPRNPVPTVGGNLCCDGARLPPGPWDQAGVERRDDVLVYTSKPLAADLTVIGNVKVEMFARSTAPDTDFTAKLVDVHPDGYAQNVVDRVIRASLREGSKSDPSLITPGRAYDYDLDLGNTAMVFPAGHRIRLEISSSNFPHYARNLNTGETDGPDSSIRTARQTILHSDRYPSQLHLPVVDGVQPAGSGS